jgi:hypothetical protein
MNTTERLRALNPIKSFNRAYEEICIIADRIGSARLKYIGIGIFAGGSLLTLYWSSTSLAESSLKLYQLSKVQQTASAGSGNQDFWGIDSRFIP